MKRFVNKAVWLAVVFCVWGLAWASEDDKPDLRLEFRRAETKPAKDLEEATDPKTGEKVYVHRAAEATNEDIADASIDKGVDILPPMLTLRFTKRGRARMEKLTREHQGKPLVVLIDGKVRFVAVVRSTITEQAVLSGLPNPEMERIVKALRGK